MSNQGGFHNQGSAQDHQGVPNSNPWADQQSQQPQQYRQYEQQPPQQQQGQAGYEAPPGPPPRRTNTFEETSFVPADQRGEQREALEQFEMNKSQPESQTDRDVATLSEEFPKIDGSLIAALYGDSQSLSATREMLQELASQEQ